MPAFSTARTGFLGPSVANSRQHSTCQAQAAWATDGDPGVYSVAGSLLSSV
jgi:hypothetical protein